MKTVSSALLAVLVVVACFALPGDANAAWIGTQAGEGTIETITTQNLHNYYWTTVRISTSFPNCGTNIRDAIIPKRTPSPGNQVQEAHDQMVNMALSAYLAGKRVAIWTENIVYPIFGNNVTVCVIQQIMVKQ